MGAPEIQSRPFGRFLISGTKHPEGWVPYAITLPCFYLIFMVQLQRHKKAKGEYNGEKWKRKSYEIRYRTC